MILLACVPGLRIGDIKNESATNQAARISTLRVFCRYLNDMGFPAYIPPKGFTRKCARYDAHIYTDEELKKFFAAVDRGQSVPGECPYRGEVMPVFFRILYTSGMRVSELRLARVRDFNLDQGYINVHEAKKALVFQRQTRGWLPLRPLQVMPSLRALNVLPRCRKLPGSKRKKHRLEKFHF